MQRITIILFFSLILVLSILTGILIRKNENFSICDRFPNLPQCNRRQIVPRRNRLTGLIPRPELVGIISSQPRNALAVSGGGLYIVSIFHGAITAGLQTKRQANRDPYIKLSDMKYDYMTGISGGGVAISMMAYDKTYNDMINPLNLTAQSVKENFLNNFIDPFIALRNRYTDFDTNMLESLELPYFVTALMGISSTLFDGIEGLLGLGGTSKLAQLYLLDRHNNTKMSDVLPEYSHAHVILPAAILTTGNLNFPNIPSLNLSYNLPTGDACKRFLPYENGPLTTSERYGDVILKTYNARSLNELRYWDIRPSLSPTGPLPDNTMFDTCDWVQKYEEGVFFNTIQPYKVYRCKNIASGECCQNNSYNTRCTMGSLVYYSSRPNTLPFVVPERIYPENTQYYSYNVATEKEPTGEWQDEATDLILYDAKKIVADVPTTIHTMDYNTSDELLYMVTAANTALSGIMSDPCYLKSVLYRGGFSDQEEFANRINSLSLNLNPYLRTNSERSNNRRLYKNLCSLLGDNTTCSNDRRSYTELNPNYDISIPLKEIVDKMPLCAVDGGVVDTSGVVASVVAHQNSIYDKRPLNIFNITCNISDTYVLFDISPYHEYGDSKTFNDYDDMLKELMDTVNDVANWNILQEAAFLAGTVAGGAIVSGLASVLSPIVGVAVTATLILSLSETVWEMLDLDTDYHETVDKEGKEFSGKFVRKAPIIFSGYWLPDIKRERIIQREGDMKNFKIRLSCYKNRTTLNNEILGVKEGTKINLTVIDVTSEGSKNIPLVPFFDDNGEKWAEMSRIVFDGVRELAQSDGTISELLKDAFTIN